LAAVFGIREWKASALSKNWEFSKELEHEWNDTGLREARAEVARYCILHSKPEYPADLTGPVIRNQATTILDFYENVGFLVKKGAIKREFAWILFHHMVKTYQPHLAGLVKDWRSRGKIYDGTYYDMYEHLIDALDKEQNKQTEGWLYYLTRSKPANDENAGYPMADELQIDIRRATHSDLERLFDLEKASVAQDAGRLEKCEIEKWLEKAASLLFVVESIGKHLIAYALYTESCVMAPVDESEPHNSLQTAEIISITIHPYFRGSYPYRVGKFSMNYCLYKREMCLF